MKALALSLALVLAASAAAAPPGPPAVPGPAGKTVSGRVVKVDAAKMMLTVKDDREMRDVTFIVTLQTKIQAVNRGTTLRDIAVNDTVTVEYVEEGALRALSIRAVPAMGK